MGSRRDSSQLKKIEHNHLDKRSGLLWSWNCKKQTQRYKRYPLCITVSRVLILSIRSSCLLGATSKPLPGEASRFAFREITTGTLRFCAGIRTLDLTQHPAVSLGTIWHSSWIEEPFHKSGNMQMWTNHTLGRKEAKLSPRKFAMTWRCPTLF